VFAKRGKGTDAVGKVDLLNWWPIGFTTYIQRRGRKMLKSLKISSLIERLSRRWPGRSSREFYIHNNAESILRSNLEKDVKALIEVICDLDKVRVGETDNGNITIKLIDGSGRSVTLWMSGNKYENEISSITSY